MILFPESIRCIFHDGRISSDRKQSPCGSIEKWIRTGFVDRFIRSENKAVLCETAMCLRSTFACFRLFLKS